MLSPEFKIVKSMVSGYSDYRRMYPDINKFNIFSISRLSWDHEKYVDMKLGRRRDDWNARMMAGRIIGQAIQHAFIATDARWHSEVETRITLPYNWKNFALKDIILIGHVDLVHFERRVIVELKTSIFDSKIRDFAKLQVSAYWSGLYKATNKPFKAKIIKVSVPPREITLNYHSKVFYAKVLFKRAYECAKMLDTKENFNATKT